MRTRTLLRAENHGCDPTYYDISTPERRAGAMLDIFRQRQRMTYYDSPRSVVEMDLIAAALGGDAKAAERILRDRSSRGFESECIDVIDLTVVEDPPAGAADVEAG